MKGTNKIKKRVGTRLPLDLGEPSVLLILQCRAAFTPVDQGGCSASAAKRNVSVLGTFTHGAWSDLCSFCDLFYTLLSLSLIISLVDVPFCVKSNVTCTI